MRALQRMHLCFLDKLVRDLKKLAFACEDCLFHEILKFVSCNSIVSFVASLLRKRKSVSYTNWSC